MFISEIVDYVTQTGGGSFKSTDEGWEQVYASDGYYVSVSGGMESVEESQLEDAILTFAFARIDVWNKPQALLGIWRDDNGEYSIDVSMRFEHIETAMLAGKLGNQRAIWDIYNHKAITI